MMRRQRLRRMRRRPTSEAMCEEREKADAEELARHRRNAAALGEMIAYADSRGYEHANEDAMLSYARRRIEALGGGQ